ncbi:hypothetical protein Esti_005963 [Eimeria stiedai]
MDDSENSSEASFGTASRDGSNSSNGSSSNNINSSSSSNRTLGMVLTGSLEAAAAALRKRAEAADDVDEDAQEAGPPGEPPSSRLHHLTELQTAVLSNLTQRQLLAVVDGVLGGKALDSLLKATAPLVTARRRLNPSMHALFVVDANHKPESKYDRPFFPSSSSAAAEQAAADKEASDAAADAAVAAAAAAAAAAAKRKDSKEGGLSAEQYIHLAKFVPLRLTYDERRFLRLLEGALEVSEYTERVDVIAGGSRARRTAREIRLVCAILTGLVVAHDYEEGQRLLREMDFGEQSRFFQAVFEIGRRYKILNPERMRSAYGKLVYFLMDSTKPDIQQLLQFDLVTPVHTVYSLLAPKKNGLALLRDPLIRVATREIMPEDKTRAEIDREIREKENAIKTLSRKYAGKQTQKQRALFGLRFNIFGRSDNEEPADVEANDASLLTAEDIEQCLYSLADHNTYLRFNKTPCDRMIQFLHEYFSPETAQDEFSLAISYGSGGARLSHSHRQANAISLAFLCFIRQYLYVLQSLTLWREICSEMFVLWAMAEADLLQSNNHYRLRDTGQGLNRVQEAPRVSRAMQTILERVQRQTCGWVGSSVVHLGDNNVPNALMFIDKYTQVPRILGPLVLCLDKLPELYEKPALRLYFDTQFGGLHKLR